MTKFKVSIFLGLAAVTIAGCHHSSQSSESKSTSHEVTDINGNRTETSTQVESIQSPEGDKFSYRFTKDGCDTGKKTFESKAAYCDALKNEDLNQGCASTQRNDQFQKVCANGHESDPSVTPPMPMPSIPQIPDIPSNLTGPEMPSMPHAKELPRAADVPKAFPHGDESHDAPDMSNMTQLNESLVPLTCQMTYDTGNGVSQTASQTTAMPVTQLQAGEMSLIVTKNVREGKVNVELALTDSLSGDTLATKSGTWELKTGGSVTLDLARKNVKVTCQTTAQD